MYGIDMQYGTVSGAGNLIRIHVDWKVGPDYSLVITGYQKELEWTDLVSISVVGFTLFHL